ncbi:MULTISPECIES: alpha,alpha-trehalose-phosphate synthase (UDP-forming) [Gluconobacter]|uniref:alpha,alpha-trehalose-phosphate synthase (UDP-forming) n=1 Tax=Gluconobacter TaxID=441 RepID=UPI001B8BCE84|nr:MULTISPECIES: trehalose-6-phosphate synthase [Gluconobacter]MBS0995661.1 trehalose-6-phosphate synthase [Gluconobacter cerinus]MBS1023438.1 trehalose-6-phosphate synthase [Gluconobacter cerinus]MBS1033491.1 trehalose-6-phosphate synthase [Gluconobacter cerinus]
MGRLIVVSNRTPAPGERTQPAGGLTVGLYDAVQTRDSLWFGWSGEQCEDALDRPVMEDRAGNVTYATFDMTPRQYDRFYLNFSNGVLWPLCHYRTQLIRYTREDCEAYYEANAVFADRLVPLLKEDDTIWIHDYHLFPLAEMLRDRGVTGRIGFFLHIPFPPWSVARLLPQLQRLLKGLAGCDRIGVQTPEDAQNLRGCFAEYGLKAEVEAVPIGIDPIRFRQQAIESASTEDVEQIVDSLVGKRLIIGVDRLDYSKGLPERMRGYEMLLKNYPEYRGKVTFLQITPVSRTGVESYRLLKEELDGLVGTINGAYGTPDWVPIRYTTWPISRNVLAGLYRVSDVGYITPLRDGMNLVAKEFIAAQDSKDPGVLVLSRFAGAAPEMPEALQVNPLDAEGMADALHAALTMDVQTRHEAWSALYGEVSRNTAGSWAKQFLDSLEASRT